MSLLKHSIVLLFFFLAHASSIYAQGFDLQILARPGDVIDGVPLSSNFQFPTLNNNGLIAFINGPNGGVQSSLFVMTTAGKDSGQIVFQHEDVIAGIPNVQISGPDINELATLDTLSGNLSVAAASGAFKTDTCTFIAGDLQCDFVNLAATGDVIDGRTLGGFNSIAPINDSGLVTFSANAVAGGDSQNGIFLHDTNQTSLVVIAEHIIDEKCLTFRPENHMLPARTFRNDGTILFSAPFISNTSAQDCDFFLLPDGYGVFTSREGSARSKRHRHR